MQQWTVSVLVQIMALHQAIILTNDGLLSNVPLGTNLNYVLVIKNRQNFFIHENTAEDSVCETLIILSTGRWINNRRFTLFCFSYISRSSWMSVININARNIIALLMFRQSHWWFAYMLTVFSDWKLPTLAFILSYCINMIITIICRNFLPWRIREFHV